MTLDEAYEYVQQAAESESEQRAEYGMGAVSLGYDPAEVMVHYEGYRTSDDETFAEAQRIIRASYTVKCGCGTAIPEGVAQCYPCLENELANYDDIPF